MQSTHPYRYRIPEDIHYAMPEDKATAESFSERNTRRNYIWFNQSTPKSYEVVTLTLSAVNKDVKITALVTPVICPPLSSSKHTEIPVALKALAFADPLNAEGDPTIDMLIGNDHYVQIIVENTKKSQDERWMPIQSKFGWLLSGLVPNNESSTETTISTLCQMVGAQSTRNEDLNETLTKFWEINKIPDECNDTEVTDVQKHFQDTIEFNKVTGRHTVRLPWKDKQNLPTNFTLTRKRLSNLQHTLKGKHPELIFKYNEQLLDQLKRGFIQQVLDWNIHQGDNYTLHIPFSSLQGKQHNSYENRLRRFSKTIIEGIQPQRLPSYRA